MIRSEEAKDGGRQIYLDVIQKVSVILLEDHLLVRQGLRSMLESSGEVEVVGEAGSAEEGLELLRELVCDVVLLDLNLPGRSGLWCTSQIGELHPGLPVLILSMHTQRSIVGDAVKAGARGFVAKSAHSDELMAGVRALAAGGSYFDARAAGAVLAMARGEETTESGLSPREDQVLRLVCQGLSNHLIAEQMNLSVSSIKIHLRALFSHFGVSDRTSLVTAFEARARLLPTRLPEHG